MSQTIIVNETMQTSPATGTIKDSATWSSSGYIELTTNTFNQHGEFEYNQLLPATFDVYFDFYMGPNNPGADAIYFYFGCASTPANEDDSIGGYILSFDEYNGEGRPYIIQFNGQTLANTTGYSTFSDSAWHKAHITINNTVLTMTLDNVQVLEVTDVLRTLGGNLFGWGGRTGAVSNEHRIRNLLVVSNTNVQSPVIQVFISDVGTGDLFEVPFTSLNFIDELNNGKQATINLDYQAVKGVATAYNTTVQDLFTSTFRELWIEFNGTKVWYGVISEYNRSKDATGQFQMSIAAIDYFSLFQKRRTGLTKVRFTSVDPATIPWSLINTSQQSDLPYSDFGITQGVTASTGLSFSIDYTNAEVRQEIINLSNYRNLGTFDFDIDFTKKLNVYYPTKGSIRSGIVLDDNNILADTVKIPLLLSLTNSIFVTGQGINTDIAAVNVKASTSVRNAYKLLEDQYSSINISDPNLLAATGNKYLQLNQLPLYQITLKHHGDDVDITTYDVGDTLIVDIPEEGVVYQQYRVKKRTVDIDAAANITVTLDMLLV